MAKKQTIQTDSIYKEGQNELNGKVDAGFIYLLTEFSNSEFESEILGFPLEAKEPLIKWLQGLK